MIEEQHGVCSRRDGSRDLRQVERHAFGLPARKHQAGPLALGGAYRAIDVRRRGADP